MNPSAQHILILEIIAFVAMVTDHIGRSGIYPVPGWEIVGRLAFPLFALTFAYNAATYQRCNIKKLLLIGLIALPGTTYLMNLHFWQPNIMFTFPLAWLVFRFFADKQRPGDFLLKPLGLWLGVVILSLGPAYDLRGIAFISTAIWLFSVKQPRERIWIGLACYLFFVSTLAATPGKILPVTGLLGCIYGLVMLVPSREIVRDQSTWWARAGFGKWYVLQAYALCSVKILLAAAK